MTAAGTLERDRMNDAETRLAERLAPDLERVLGAGIVLEDVEVGGVGPVTIRVACLEHGMTREIEASGATAIEAITKVIRLATEERLASAFRQLVDPG
jgi:hypothetical protein